MNILQEIVSKMLSGRWILAVTSCAVFIYMTVTGKMDGDKAMAVIMLVAGFYFGKSRIDGEKK